MSRDASLDEFLGGTESEASGEGGEESGEGAEIDGEDDGVGGVESEEVSPASATYTWTPAGDACARCGSSVERMWRCEGELVCGECKEW